MENVNDELVLQALAYSMKGSVSNQNHLGNYDTNNLGQLVLGLILQMIWCIYTSVSGWPVLSWQFSINFLTWC